MTLNDALLEVINLPELLMNNRFSSNIELLCLNRNGYISGLNPCPLLEILESIAQYVSDGLISDAQHPTVKLFVGLMESNLLVQELSRGDLSAKPNKSLTNRVIDFIDEFLLITNGYRFKKQILNMRRMQSRNTNSIYSYISHLFDRYSRLLVVRVDFHYLKVVAKEIPLEHVVTHREQFIRAVKKQFEHLTGLCWKLEYGEDRAFHYHMVFFFNGAHQQQDITIGRRLGELWQGITDGQGTYYNCNRDKDKYRESYLGQVIYHDNVKRNAMRYLEYLVKRDDAIVALQCRGRVKTFERMEISHRKSNAGRPRTLPV